MLDIDESSPCSAAPNSFYGRAKMLAERALLRRGGGLEVIILRPPFVWAPKSHGVESVLEAVRQRRFMWIDHGPAPFEAIHVTNLVSAIVNALSQGRPRAVYLVADAEKHSARQFFEPLIEAHGVAVPRRSVPGWLARSLAAALESLWRGLRLRGKPPLTRFEVAFMGQPRRYRSDLAASDLGYTAVLDRAKALAGCKGEASTPRPKR